MKATRTLKNLRNENKQLKETIKEKDDLIALYKNALGAQREAINSQLPFHEINVGVVFGSDEPIKYVKERLSRSIFDYLDGPFPKDTD